MTQDIMIAIAATAGVMAVLFFVLTKAMAPKQSERSGLAKKVGDKIIADAAFAQKAQDLLTPPPPPPPEKPKPNTEPIRLLALLQREGRLLDFLMESIQGYADAQIGAAVRDIHQNCSKAIQDHLVLEPVMTEDEGAQVEVKPGFDPSVVRLVGNVTGQPPFRGTLQHRGWRVREIKLAPLPEGQNPWIVQPAEVELA